MAHSLRSKTKLKAKKVKTSDPKSDYFQAAKARTERLAQKLKENTDKQQLETPATSADDKMDESSENPADDLTKVKTHGWRKSRASNYKKKKASKKNKSLKF